MRVPHPVSFTLTNRYDLGNGWGALHSEYHWGSSTGSVNDLSSCSVGEFTTYPGYPNSANPWPWPSPYPAISTDNPTTGSVPGSDGGVYDNNWAYTPNTVPVFRTPYTSLDFTVTQYFRYKCGNQSQWTVFAGPIYIYRSVEQNPNSSWYYAVSKSDGSGSAGINPLP
jgi:hypothetical protein